MNRGVPAHLSPQVPPQSDDAMFPGLALLAENSARNLEPLLQPIPVPNQRQMLLCKLLERANIGIKRPGKNLSFLRLCRDARVVFDEGNSRPFGLNARQRYGHRCQIITESSLTAPVGRIAVQLQFPRCSRSRQQRWAPQNPAVMSMNIFCHRLL